MKLKLVAVLWLGPLLLLGGCATSGPKNLYPDFQKAKDTPLVLVMDVAVVHDVGGRVDKMDVFENQALAEQLAKQIEADVEKKGYRVERSMISSMGLMWKPEKDFRVASAEDHKTLPVEKLPLAKPPFYLDKACQEGSGVQESLHKMYGELATVTKKKGEANRKVAIAPIVPEEEGANLLVLMVGGRDVPMGKQIGQIFLSSLLTLGTFAIWQTSGLGMELYVVDTRSGEVRWADRRFVKGGRANPKAFARLAQSMTQQFP